MRKHPLLILSFCLVLILGVSCGSKEQSKPGDVVVNFLNAMQDQDYAAAKLYYAETVDNLPNFRNKIESISPHVADEFFKKMADFSYTIKKVELNPDDENKANVYVSFQCYDLGNTLENTILEYLKTDLSMTFDGASADDIVKKAEEVIMDDLDGAQQNFHENVIITLTKEDKEWKLDKIGENHDLLNALAANIIDTIDDLDDIIS